MPAPIWQPSTTYLPGAIVRPSGSTGTTAKTGQPDNADFESGATGWTLGADTALASDKVFSGTQALKFTGTTTATAGVLTISTDQRAVIPGQSVSATCYGNTGGNSGGASVTPLLVWYDADGTALSQIASAAPVVVSRGAWKASTVSGIAPAGAAKVAVAVGFIRETGSTDSLWADKVSWNYTPPVTPTGLIFKAVQPAAGKSAGTEPKWPSTLGVQVTDNQVIWEAVEGTLIEWTMHPLNLSGATEPAWPTIPGALVDDNGMTWKAVSPAIADPNCPHSKIITSGANKIFAGDGDITRFCATNDATDWSSEQDAGYIPTGLYAIGETDVSALAIYRANLAVWTASSQQIWQIDPDPANMAFIDAVIGGTDYLRTPQAIANDLQFLSGLGVRSVGVTATTGTMGGTDVGSPVDPPIRDALKAYNDAIAAGERPTWDPLAVAYPNASQNWVFLGNEAYVYALSVASKVSAWQHYTLPFVVTDAAILDGELYVRSDANDLYVLDETLFADDGVIYDVQAQLPWLDLGLPGVTKMAVGVDVVIAQGGADSNTYASLGWDENNTGSFTPEVAIADDTQPGTILPIPTAGATLSLKLRNASADSWEFSAATIYFNALRKTS